MHSAPEQPQSPDGDTALSRTDGEEPAAAGESGFSLATLFSRSHSVLPDGQPTILLVCTGNICRSALAGVILRTRLEDLGVTVLSAGTHALVGHGMPPLSRGLAEQNGVSRELFDHHRATLLTENLMSEADLILTMTHDQSTLAVQLAPRCLHRTFALREFGRLSLSLSDQRLRDVSERAENPRSRLNAMVTLIADQRGLAPRAVESDDVVDPYRRSAAVYAQSADEMLPALLQVERAVRAALARADVR